MEATYRMNANELSEDFVKSLKAIFKNQTISITVSAEMDETAYLLSSKKNRSILEQSLHAEEGYVFTGQEFEQLNQELLEGKKPDIDKLKKQKI